MGFWLGEISGKIVSILIIFMLLFYPSCQKFYIQIYSNIIICWTPVTGSIYSP